MTLIPTPRSEQPAYVSAVADPCRRNKLLRLLARDGDRCHWCAVAFSTEVPPTFEHLIPRHYGGGFGDGNLVLACAPCNNGRNDRTRCAGCGCRIRRWGSACWVDRREAFHAVCIGGQS